MPPRYSRELNILASVKVIGRNALNSQATLTRVVKIIDTLCFDYSDLTAIVSPPTLGTIGDGAFISCTFLKALAFPESLRVIGEGAFEGCAGLNTNITIPVHVERIARRAFYLSSNIDTVIIMNCNTFIGSQALDSGNGDIDHFCVISKAFTAYQGLSIHSPKYVPVRLFTFSQIVYI